MEWTVERETREQKTFNYTSQDWPFINLVNSQRACDQIFSFEDSTKFPNTIRSAIIVPPLSSGTEVPGSYLQGLQLWIMLIGSSDTVLLALIFQEPQLRVSF